MSGNELNGKVAIVTGGTAGIGRAIAEALLEDGADVVVCARSAPESLPAREDGKKATFVQADVRELDAIKALVAGTVAQHGRLDVLVNNAGGSPYVPAAEASPRFSEAIIRLNLLAPLWLSQEANAVMQRQAEGGAIVHVTSVSGLRASPGTAAYGAAKAGLINLAKSQAVEWAPKVRVNCVTAGLVQTEKSLAHYGGEERLAAVAATVPMGRLGSPRDVAEAVLFLASARAAYVTGAQLVVHGGDQWPAFLIAAQAGDGRG